MLKTLNFGKRALIEHQKTRIWKRFLLSASYKCEDAWNDRLNNQLLHNVNTRDMINDIELKFQRGDSVSAIDVDIFVNKVDTENYVADVINILERLRVTAQTTYTLESTHHAVVRLLLKLNKYEALMNILQDRLKYGIFPDHQCYNLMMDTFLEKQDYGKAVQVATLLMLQEDSENALTTAFALYSCGKYMEDPSVWTRPEEEPQDEGEPVKVRIAYLRNPFFDGHFDLKKPEHLVGKTLVFYGKNSKSMLRRSLLLRGWLLMEDYTRLREVLNSWKEDMEKESTVLLFQDDINFVEKHLSTLEDKPSDIIESINVMKQKGQFAAKTLLEVLHKSLMVQIEENKDRVEQFSQTYQHWIRIREEELDKQQKELEKNRALTKIKESKSKLATEEQLLTFFDKEEKIELQIEKQEAEQAAAVEKVKNIKRSARKLRKLVANDTYVAPELLSILETNK